MSFYSTCNGACNRGCCNGAFACDSCPCANPFCSGYSPTIIPSSVINNAPITNILLRTARLYNATASTVATGDNILLPITASNNSINYITNNGGIATLLGAGIYNIDYSATITNPSATASIVGSLGLAINGNVDNTYTTSNTMPSSSTITLSNTAQIVVPSGLSYTVSMVNNSTSSITLANANMVITKVA